MIVITKVETMSFPEWRDHVTVMKTPPMETLSMDPDDETQRFSIGREEVLGRTYIDQKGMRVMIGVVGDAAEILGLQYRCWEELEYKHRWALERAERMQSSYNSLRKLYQEDHNDLQRVIRDRNEISGRLHDTKQALRDMCYKYDEEKNRLHHRVYRKIKYWIFG